MCDYIITNYSTKHKTISCHKMHKPLSKIKIILNINFVQVYINIKSYNFMCDYIQLNK